MAVEVRKLDEWERDRLAFRLGELGRTYNGAVLAVDREIEAIDEARGRRQRISELTARLDQRKKDVQKYKAELDRLADQAWAHFEACGYKDLELLWKTKPKLLRREYANMLGKLLQLGGSEDRATIALMLVRQLQAEVKWIKEQNPGYGWRRPLSTHFTMTGVKHLVYWARRHPRGQLKTMMEGKLAEAPTPFVGFDAAVNQAKDWRRDEETKNALHNMKKRSLGIWNGFELQLARAEDLRYLGRYFNNCVGGSYYTHPVRQRRQAVVIVREKGKDGALVAFTHIGPPRNYGRQKGIPRVLGHATRYGHAGADKHRAAVDKMLRSEKGRAKFFEALGFVNTTNEAVVNPLHSIHPTDSDIAIAAQWGVGEIKAAKVNWHKSMTMLGDAQPASIVISRIYQEAAAIHGAEEAKKARTAFKRWNSTRKASKTAKAYVTKMIRVHETMAEAALRSAEAQLAVNEMAGKYNRNYQAHHR